MFTTTYIIKFLATIFEKNFIYILQSGKFFEFLNQKFITLLLGIPVLSSFLYTLSMSFFQIVISIDMTNTIQCKRVSVTN